MKNLFLVFAIVIVFAFSAQAHYMWIETSPKGAIGQAQDVNVFFGEYTYGLTEKVGEEAFNRVQNFTLWVVSPSGKKMALKTRAGADSFSATYTPSENGTHAVILNNDNIEVIDYTKYDFGVFKTHYHSMTQIQVGEAIAETAAQNEAGIAVKRLADEAGQVKLLVLYKNQPLAENELKVFVSDQWEKALYTDENGIVSFALPWNTKYIIETTKKEEVPGEYKGETYQFTWHCATVSILP